MTSARNEHVASGYALGYAVLDGVLHKRLQEQIGYLRTQNFLGYIDAYLQTLSETDLLNLDVALQILDLLSQGDLRAVGVLRCAPQELAESDDHAHCGVVSVIANQAGDRIERVVHEVRLYLPAQRRKLSFRELLIDARSLDRLPCHAFASIEEVGGRQYQRIRDQECNRLEHECRAPGVYEVWPFPIAPRVEPHLQQCRPRLGNGADACESCGVHT